MRRSGHARATGLSLARARWQPQEQRATRTRSSSGRALVKSDRVAAIKGRPAETDRAWASRAQSVGAWEAGGNAQTHDSEVSTKVGDGRRGHSQVTG